VLTSELPSYPAKPRLLCLSNGHGEDAIALRILQALQRQANAPELAALPIVGEGHTYRHHDIPLIGPVKTMPSGGFIHMDGRQFVRDLHGGLIQLTLRQLRTVRQWAAATPYPFILAVGDLVPLLFAWWSGAPYAFIGTAKSEYYVRDEFGVLPRNSWFDDRIERWMGSVYYPWERCLMRHPRCKAVFPRDHLTTASLKQWAIPAFDLGNPMMDGLDWTAESTSQQDTDYSSGYSLPSALTIALLPGSRPPEAYHNWQRLLRTVPELLKTFPNQPLRFLAAIAPGLDQAPLIQPLIAQGWQQAKDEPNEKDPTSSSNSQRSFPLIFTWGQATLTLTTAFNHCIHEADVAIAMAGTATEQFVGLGKPAIILPGAGPQFTATFAEAQTRLLGCSVILVQQPEQVAGVLKALLNDPDRLHQIGENGRHRMGEPGAAERIADCLIQQLERK
jgi:uncharacterized protein (TIGR03492 family)